MAVRDLLTKQPFYRLVNSGKDAQQYNKPICVDQMQYHERNLMGSIMTQADYLEEFYPFSHRVMSDFYFPEFYNYTTETNDKGEDEIKFHREETFRIGSTLQGVITAQQLVHLCCNDIHWELTADNVTSDREALYKEYKKGWLRKNMEIDFYDLAKSVKVTADGAVVFFMDNRKLGKGVV